MLLLTLWSPGNLIRSLWVDEDARRADFGPVWAVIMAFFQRARYVFIYILYTYIHTHIYIYIWCHNLYINTFDKWWILHIYWCLFFCRLHIRTGSGSAPLTKKWESPLCNYACWFFKTQLTIQLLIPLYHVISCYIMLYHVISCYIMLYHVISCYIMLYHVISCYIPLITPFS